MEWTSDFLEIMETSFADAWQMRWCLVVAIFGLNDLHIHIHAFIFLNMNIVTE